MKPLLFLLFPALILCPGARAQTNAQTGPALTIYSAAGGFGLSGTLFFPIGGGANPPNNIESVVQTTMSTNTSISHFGVRVSNALGSGNVATFTIRKNSTNTNVTCMITHPAVTCQDLVNVAAVSIGDLVDIRATFNNTVSTGSSVIVSFSIQIGGAGVAPGQITLILSGTCPVGFTEVAALAGKTLIGTTSAAGNVGTTGGTDTITPTGTVAAPTFTGAALAGHTHTITGLVQNASAGTPTGTVGAINATGTPTLTSANAAGQNVANFVHTHPAPTFTGVALPTHTHAPGTLANSTTTAGTPAGTNSAPAFTGAAFDNRSAFVRVIFCVKD